MVEAEVDTDTAVEVAAGKRQVVPRNPVDSVAGIAEGRARNSGVDNPEDYTEAAARIPVGVAPAGVR